MARGIQALVLGAAVLVSANAAEARGFQSIYSFPDDYNYSGALLRDAAGNLYGTTLVGGASNAGSVFVLSPAGVRTTLHDFTYDASTLARPDSGVVMDAAGNLYGEANFGGGTICGSGGSYIYCGGIFKLAPDGTLTTVHAFQGGLDGGLPTGGLTIDKQGNLFGTTSMGGTGNFCPNSLGCGTVFKIAPNGTKTILYNFQGKYDGGGPGGQLIRDKHHNLYGVTGGGGYGSGYFWGYGTVYKLAPNGTETQLYVFQGQADGAFPTGSLAVDTDGNLYGTLLDGPGSPNGAIFKLTPGGTETILHTFGSVRQDGLKPIGNLLVDKKGDLYGTTSMGGKGCHYHGCGTVYKIAHDGTYSHLYEFQGGIAHQPTGGLVQDAQGHLFGSSMGIFNGFHENYGEIYTLSK